MLAGLCSYLGAQNLLINEIMADPNPVVGLPEAEYVELYNAGDTAVALAGLAIGSGGRPKEIGGAGSLPAGGYALLLRPRDTAAFAGWGARILPTALPALTNGGDELTLLRGSDTLLQLTYTTDWYQDADRDGGGYSLAYTGAGAVDCGGAWRASLAEGGGTPGAPNLVRGLPADTLPPQLEKVKLLGDTVRIAFDEAPVPPPVFTIDELPVAPVFDGERSFVLAPVPLRPGQTAGLRILGGYTDCVGNVADDLLYVLLAPAPATAQNVIINELLFNPRSGGKDYVELHNRSDKTFRLSDWRLLNPASPTTARTLTSDHLLPPGDYVVLTEGPDVLADRFPNVDLDRVVATRLPSLPDDAGTLQLIGPEGRVVDALSYRDDWHNALLSPPEGVALERLDPAGPTNEPDNWASAAGGVGYGTPTRPNSQTDRPAASEVVLRDATFSPDGDGYRDVLAIDYRLARPGMLARMAVYDTQGRPVLVRPRNQLLAASGSLEWDGRDADRRLVPPGPYVILLELFAPDGRAETHKLVAVRAG